MARKIISSLVYLVIMAALLQVSTVIETAEHYNILQKDIVDKAKPLETGKGERGARADISIALIPDDPEPVEVAAGESFSSAIFLTNNINEAQTVDLWIMVRVPNGYFYGPVHQWNDVSLEPFEELQIPVVQAVGTWPPRLPYKYFAYAGTYPSAVDASDSFNFRVRPERGAVELKLTSSRQNRTVSPGEQIDWAIKAYVSPLENNGLALISMDLVQDPTNPELFNLPPGDSAPAGVEGFDRPRGLTNPVQENPWGSGYGGTPVGVAGRRDLAQIGGSQNTFGVRGPCLGPNNDICMGRDPNIYEGICQAPAGRLIATGSFNAPATNGTYTFFIDSAIANTLDIVPPHPLGVTPVLPAKVNLLKPDFSFHVSDNPSPGETDFPDLSPRSLPSREVVILPPEGAVMNRLHMQFRWDPFDVPPVEYTLWLVEDNLNGDPFNNGFPVQSFQVEGTEPRTMVTTGLEFGKPFAWCVTDGVPPTSPTGEIGPTHRFTTMEIPAWMPDITVTNPGGAASVQPGLTLFRGPRMEDPESYQYLLMVNASGDIVYFLKTPLLSDVRLLETGDGRNGRIFGGRTRAFEFSLDGKVLWLSPDEIKIHHEAFPMPGGNVLTLTNEVRTVLINEEPVTRRGDIIIEFDRWSREVVWDWNMFDYYSVEHGDLAPDGSEQDWTHANSVVYDPALNRVYVSVRHLSRITAIDYDTGDIIYNMGKDWGDTHFGHNLFTAQHAIQLLPDGNMMVYDNGNWNEPLEDPRQSKAIELAFSPDHASPLYASIVWEYGLVTDTGDPFFCVGMGDADRLPNGNTLVTGRHLYTIWEVDAGADLVWKLRVTFPQGEEYNLYRAERIDGMLLDTVCDSDGDQDLDMEDFAQMQAGYTGEGPVVLTFPFTLSDYDGDSDIDLYDVADFLPWMTGPGL